jgi:hypothetical protein
MVRSLLPHHPFHHVFVTYLFINDSGNCIDFSCDCEYDAREHSSEVIGTSAVLGDSGDGGGSATVGDESAVDSRRLLSPRRQQQWVAKATGKAGPAPGLSFYGLPVTQHRLLYHMSSMSDLIGSAHTFNLVIYMKRLPTYAQARNF